MATAPSATGQYVQIPDLALASTLSGNELLEIVQDGVSKRVAVESLRVIGQDGLSAYQIAVNNGFVGTELEWVASLTGKSAFEIAQELDPSLITPEQFIASLKGDKGYSAYEVAQMNNPNIGTEEEWLASLKGADGKSAYEQAKEAGFSGSELEWVQSLVGKSAYEVAVEEGFLGTVDEWLLSLIGKNAYEVAKDEGFVGTPAEWLESLRGAKGDDGAAGKSAYQSAVDNGYEGTEAEWVAGMADQLTYEKLQALLNLHNWTAAGVVRLLNPNGGFVGNSAHVNFLFGYDKRLANQDNGSPAKVPQRSLEMSRMEAEGFSYWKNASASSDDGKLPEVPMSEVRLYDTGVLQIGSIDKFLEFTGGALVRVVDGGNETVIDLSRTAQSAYDVAVAAGFEGTVEEWLASLKGADGRPGDRGVDGKSAYQIAMDNGFVGTETQWLASLKGADGVIGADGADGKSAYEVAVEAGFEGDEAAWLISLKGANGTNGTDGADGASAYAVAVEEGFEGTVDEWLASLKGVDGEPGERGNDGATGPMGPYTRIVGSKATPEDLPDPVTSPGEEAYLVQGYLYVIVDGGWQEVGYLKGSDGIGLRVLGSFPNTALLPTEGNTNGDTWIVDKNMWVWANDKWEQVGQVGPRGERGEQGIQGIQGIQGPQGLPAHSIDIAGAVPSAAELPPSAEEGKSYITLDNNHLMVRMSDSSWFDAGEYSGESAYQIAVRLGYEGTEVEWIASLKGEKGDQGIQGIQGVKGEDGVDGTNGTNGTDGADGVDGKSAYQIAVDGGFVGSEAEWILSLKGEKGEQGNGLTIEGRKNTQEELPETAPIGDAWLVGSDVWLMGPEGWYNAGPLGGVDGKSAYEVAVEAGFVGDETAWLASLKGQQGDTGAGLIIKGEIATTGDFPGDAATGDAYLLTTNKHVLIKAATGDIIDAGPLQGPAGQNGSDGANGTNGTNGADGADGADGKSAYEVAVAAGFVGNEAAWLASLKGADGKSAYQAAVDNGFIGTENQWLESLNGADGASFHIVGTYDEESELPPATDGAGAYIGSWVYAVVNGSWARIVELKGVDGESAYDAAVRNGFVGTEIEWIESLKGEQGIQGPMGPGIKILGSKADPSELPGTGVNGEGYVINGNFWGWTGTAYEDMGPVQGPKGDQGERGLQGAQGIPGVKGDKGASILFGPDDPKGTDGRVQDMWINTTTRSYWLKTGTVTWVNMGQFGGGDVNSPLNDGKTYLRQYNQWVETTLVEAPQDGKRYMRKDGAWVEYSFDRYDTKTMATTGVIDFMAANAYTLDNSPATGTGTKTISITNMPAGRAQVIPLTIKGSAAQFNWPAESLWRWHGNKQPSLGAEETNLIIYWNGTRCAVGAGPIF